MRKSFLKTIILGLLLLPATSLYGSEPTVSVEIVEGAKKIVVRSGNLSFYNISGDRSGTEHVQSPTAIVTANDGGIRLDGRQTGWKKMGIIADNKTIWVDGRPYNGGLTIERDTDGLLSVTNVLPIEDYLKGILPGEMPSGWPVETLKAQAVVARTYALFVSEERKRGGNKRPFDLRSTVDDQVYKGSRHVDAKITRAVEGTKGEILTFRGSPVKARFHSSCGGTTEISEHVWGEDDISKGVQDPFCKGSPNNSWTITLPEKEIRSSLESQGLRPGRIKNISIEHYKDGGRAAAVSIEGSDQTISLTGNDFRRYIGFDRIKSTNLDLKKHRSSFQFTGRGFGHGVGMCQWGAKGMAEAGMAYKDILNFYYPGTEIKKAY